MPRALPLLLVLVLSAAIPAQAHRVHIFAWVEGGMVVTESSFSASRPVRQGPVEVRDRASGALLVSGQTDDGGVFAFPVSEVQAARQGLALTIAAGEGHQGDWEMEPSEYLQDTAAQTATPDTEPALSPSPTAQPGVAAPDLEALLDRKLAPIKRELAALRDTGPGLAEVVGGLGWIMGLVGVYAYRQSRRGPGGRG